MSNRYEKAANFVEWDQGVNLTQKFKSGIELLLKHRRPSPENYMVKRLIESICLRQRELAYSQRHKRGYSGRATDKKHIASEGVVSLPPPSMSVSTRQAPAVSTTAKFNQTNMTREKVIPKNPIPSMTYTATHVPTEFAFSERPAALLELRRREFNSIDDALSNLPPEPAIPEKLECECPYCAVPLEREKFQGSSWRYSTMTSDTLCLVAFND